MEDGFVGFIGPATLIDGKLDKATPEKEEIRSGQVTWAALQDKYFTAAAIPTDQVAHQAVVRKEGTKLASVGLQTASVTDETATQYRLFIGPKEYETLKRLNVGLEDTIDFGWFIYGSWSIVRGVAKPVFYAIRYLYDITHNYGVAIILVTVGIKLLLAPLAYKSYKSMKQMAAVQPELLAVQKKYADDRERLNKELIKLYKDKKVNPVGGCLPMFFQIPVFVALFNILYMTIELRQAALFPVDQRFVGSGSLLRLAHSYGCHHVHSAKNPADDDGPQAGADHADLAGFSDISVRHVSRRAGALLVDKQCPDHPATSHH